MSTRQDAVLDALRQNGPCTIMEISELTGRKANDVGIALNVLSRHGFVRVVGTRLQTKRMVNIWGLVE